MDFYLVENICDSYDSIVFFDIDSTLGVYKNNASCDTSIIKKMKTIYNSYNWKTIKFIDFKDLEFNSLFLFSKLLKETNSKAICISSWNRINTPELYTKELQESFESICSFPKDWLLGFSGGSGGDRWKNTVKPFINNVNFKGKFVILDDAGFLYSNKEHLVSVDGLFGFNEKDYQESLRVLK